MYNLETALTPENVLQFRTVQISLKKFRGTVDVLDKHIQMWYLVFTVLYPYLFPLRVRAEENTSDACRRVCRGVRSREQRKERKIIWTRKKT